MDTSENNQIPALFGLKNSNRDFSKKSNWGKNIFNNAFPSSLACYMFSKNIEPVYLKLKPDGSLDKNTISVSDLFGINPLSENAFYSFESVYTPYQPLVIEEVPRVDLVVMNQDGICLRGLEIKLTALPDNSTHTLNHDQYGCEIVVRPDTIVYMALSIASSFNKTPKILSDFLKKEMPVIEDWWDMSEVSEHIPTIANVLDKLLTSHTELQQPLLIEPIWKTEGKLLQLHDNAFDIFIWSDFAFSRLFFRSAKEVKHKPTRAARSVAWLGKMLYDFALNGKIDHKQVIDNMSFNTKNDKAFSVSGAVTHQYMQSTELTTPRLSKNVIKDVILNGGEKFLSPERRLDAVILSTPNLFN